MPRFYNCGIFDIAKSMIAVHSINKALIFKSRIFFVFVLWCKRSIASSVLMLPPKNERVTNAFSGMRRTLPLGRRLIDLSYATVAKEIMLIIARYMQVKIRIFSVTSVSSGIVL